MACLWCTDVNVFVCRVVECNEHIQQDDNDDEVVDVVENQAKGGLKVVPIVEIRITKSKTHKVSKGLRGKVYLLAWNVLTQGLLAALLWR